MANRRIERAPIDRDVAEEMWVYNRKKLERLERSPSSVNVVTFEILAKAGVDLLKAASALDAEDAVLIRAARAAAQGNAAVAAYVALGEGASVEVPFAGSTTVLTRKATVDDSLADMTGWRSGWYCALATRDTSSLHLLEGASDAAMRAGPFGLDPYQFHWKAALIAARAHSADFRAALETGREALDSATIAHRDARALQRILFDLLQAVDEERAANFQEILEQALLAHKKLWRTSPFDAAVAFDALGIACMAHDRNMPIEVESDYLPACLLRGTATP